MFSRLNRAHLFLLALIALAAIPACQAFLPLPGAGTPESPVEPPSDVLLDVPPNGFPDSPALPNDSGIEGVQTFPIKAEYHNHVNSHHVNSLPTPEGNLPPPFGQHFPAWQNCGIYEQPVELGSALHSMEHGAVWLTYRPNLDDAKVKALQDLVRGHGFVLMSPYPPQTDDVVLSAWGVQLAIETVPDDRIAQFIAYYEQGPQNPEPGAPCSGAVGNPLP